MEQGRLRRQVFTPRGLRQENFLQVRCRISRLSGSRPIPSKISMVTIGRHGSKEVADHWVIGPMRQRIVRDHE
jgi:hypothetical protein